MKRFLILNLLIGLIPVTKAEVDPKIHNMCLQAQDYLCASKLKLLSLQKSKISDSYKDKKSWLEIHAPKVMVTRELVIAQM